MTLKEYVGELNEILGANPELGNVEVIYSIDDEGNGYSSVYGIDGIGHYDGEDFYGLADALEGKLEINALCIN